MWGKGAGGLEGLDLTDEQVEQAEAIHERFRPQMEELRVAVHAGSIDRDEARERADAIREAMHQSIEGILTEDQKVLLAERRAEAESRREAWQAESGEGRTTRQSAMAEALGLTAEQQGALETLRESFRSQGPPADDATREARREAHQAAIREILTDDQEAIWMIHRSIAALFAQQGLPRGADRRRSGPRGPSRGTEPGGS